MTNAMMYHPCEDCGGEVALWRTRCPYCERLRRTVVSEQAVFGELLAGVAGNPYRVRKPPVLRASQRPKMPVGDETGQSVLPALKETVEGEAVILTGWRAWRPSQPDMLQSLTKTVHWPARDVVGQCLGRGTRGSARQRVEVCAAHLDQLALGSGTDGTRGGRTCRCGIYTLKQSSYLPNYANPERWDSAYVVLGACSLYGTVVETELGFLSTHARIEALFVVRGANRLVTDGMVQYADRLARRYGVVTKVAFRAEVDAMSAPRKEQELWTSVG